jgi:CDP-L-myo-inositol myo-inositolphosphotransferase
MSKNKSVFAILKEIKSGQKRPDGIFGSFMTRPVSHFFAYISYRCRFTPNFVSFLSFVFCFIGAGMLLYKRDTAWMLSAAVFWWMGAILDAADGDLARFLKSMCKFGGWFDSFLDRGKEFIIFAVFAYCTWKDYSSEIFLLLGFLSVFSTVMSGYVSDTKKLFSDGTRNPAVKIGKRYILGMVDTRDFFIIISLLAGDMRIALFVYSTVFFVAVWCQVFMFCWKYGGKSKG